MTPLTVVMFVAGFLLLVAGAELLVRGAATLASILGVPPLIVGLTIVAYGTSTPELAVSIKAGLAGQPDIALGNVVGSNIFNVLFILGASALIRSLVVNVQLVRIDVPIMVGLSLLTLAMVVFDGRVGRIDGLVLVLGIVAYTLLVIRMARRSASPAVTVPAAAAAPDAGRVRPGVKTLAIHAMLCLVGLGLLVLGTDWFVDGAVAIAQVLGVSELVIGLTIVAAGTSMPEVFTSIVATIKGERDIAVGNVVGSNIYNILAILGVSALVTPGGLVASPHLAYVDAPIMVGVAIACLPIFFTGHRIDRWEGGVFLAYYVFYTAYLVLKSTGDTAWLPLLRSAMFFFVIPLTALTLAVSVLHERRGAAGAAAGP